METILTTLVLMSGFSVMTHFLLKSVKQMLDAVAENNKSLHETNLKYSEVLINAVSQIAVVSKENTKTTSSSVDKLADTITHIIEKDKEKEAKLTEMLLAKNLEEYKDQQRGDILFQQDLQRPIPPQNDVIFPAVEVKKVKTQEEEMQEFDKIMFNNEGV